MPAVKIIQLLCPSRHSVIAQAYEWPRTSDNVALAQIEKTWRRMVEHDVFDSWCGICRSCDLKFEVGTTPFRTLIEAKPALRAVELANIAARCAIVHE